MNIPETASPLRLGRIHASVRHAVLSFTLLAFPAIFQTARAQVVTWPTQVFAPYIDMTTGTPTALPDFAQQENQYFYSAAFITANTAVSATGAPISIPAWGGYPSLSASSGYLASTFTQLRALGGDVRVSFGGSAGLELAEYITNLTNLEAAYQSVIDEYSLTQIDFDIEGADVADYTSADRRSAALKELQTAAAAAGRPLKIWLTLPVLPSGLTSDGIYVVQSAVNAGVDLAGVNIMAMDYGDNAAPNPSGQMGTYAIDSAESLYSQLQTIFQAAGIPKTSAQLWAMVGITPMIGVNDATDEIFELTDASQLVTWAKAQGIGMLCFWSVGRDVAGTGYELGQAGYNNSGITQAPYAFTQAFEPFTGASTPTVNVNTATVSGGYGGSETFTFTVTLQPAASGTVTVVYSTANGTALAGTDYVPTTGTLTFAPGQTTQTVSVNVLADTSAEAGNTLGLVLSNITGATLGASGAQGVIQNFDTPGQFAATGQFVVTGTWSGGFNAEIDFTPTSDVSTWTVQFSSAWTLSSAWNANIIATSGSTYTVQAQGWDATAGPDSPPVSIGITGAGNPSWPQNLTFNGTPLLLNANGHGLDDAWLMNYFGSLTATDGSGDADGDGQTDMQEFAAGTNPLSGSSRFQAKVTLVNGVPRISWPGALYRRYEVQYSTTPGAGAVWHTIASQLTGSGTMNFNDIWTNMSNGPRYYRVKVLYP